MDRAGRNNFRVHIDEYESFIQKLMKDIKNKDITQNNENKFCLVEGDFIEEIYKKENCNNMDAVINFYSKKHPIFINKIKKDIKQNFRMIDKDICLLLYNDFAHEELIRRNYYNSYYKIYQNIFDAQTFNYIAGYDKLIIINENNNALLILNPIDSIINNNNYIFGIIIKDMNDVNCNIELFRKLISSDLNLNNYCYNLKNNEIIEEFEEDNNYDNKINKILENIRLYKKNILLKYTKIIIFLNLYYYEKLLKEKEKEKAFKEHQYYYLINNDLLIKYKANNHYEKICSLLKKYDENNKNNTFDYYGLRNYQCTLLNYLVQYESFDFLSNYDMNINEISKDNENYNNSYIIHDNIMKKFLGNKNSSSSKQVRVYEQNIYIIDESRIKTINIGILNDNLTFNTTYIINYEKNQFCVEEMKILFKMSFEEYRKLRKCLMKNKNNNKNNLNLYNDKQEQLGTLTILSNRLLENENAKTNNSKLISKETPKEYKENIQSLENEKIDIEKNQEELDDLKQKLIDFQKDLKSKDEELKNLIKDNNNLKNEKEILIKENKEKEERLKSLRNNEKSEFNNINKNYKDILDKYDILEKNYYNKEKEIENKAKENINLQNKNKEIEESLKAKNNENEELKKKYEKLEFDLNQKNILIKDNENKLKENINIIQSYEKNVNELENKLKLKENENNLLKENNKNKENKSKKTEKYLSSKEEEITNLKNDNLRMKKEINDKNNELNKIKNEINNISKKSENEINILNVSLIEKDEEISNLKKIKENLENNAEKNSILLNKYKEELEQAKNEKLINENKLKNIKNTNDNDNKKYQKEINALNTQISELKQRLSEKNNENEKLIKKIETNNLKLDDDKKELEKIKKNHGLEIQNVKNLQNKLNEKEEQLKNDKNIINKYESDLKQFQSKYDELNKKYENSMKEKEEQINEIISTYDNEIRKRENDNNKIKSENENVKKLNIELNKLKQLNEQLKQSNKELNNNIQLKDKEINNLKKIAEDNQSNKISENEFEKILQINDELMKQNKTLEIRQKELLNNLNYYQNLQKEFDKLKIEFNNQKLNLENKERGQRNEMNNEIKNLEQKKIELNNELYNLTLKLSEAEQKVKEKKAEYEKIKAEINKDKGDEPIPKVDDKDIIKREFKIPPNIGLNNVGATCFMNSTLQCLIHTKQLSNYFLNPQNKERILKNNLAVKNKNSLQLSPLYLELISKVWNKEGYKNYSPYNFMNGVQSMNPLFQKGQAGDAKDFIIFILEQLHSELKKNLKKEEVELEPLNQYDKNNAMQHFFSEFKEELSIISDLFFGFNETTNICLDCKNDYGSKGQAFPICYNYGIFNCLIFPLEEVKNMKNNYMKIIAMQNNMINNININNDRVSLIDCFFYNQKTDKFTGENQNYCNICRKMADSDYTSKIYVSPNILVLILNRGKGNMYKVKIDFAINIDITDFVILKDKRVTYSLFGVITHLGESGPNAHFVATCKSPVDGYWYRFNDGLVYAIQNFQTEVHDFGNPYILFYEKNN